jgi:hypothetical protein
VPYDELPPGAVPLFLPILVEDKFGAVEALHRAGIEAIPVWGIHHPYLNRGEFPGTEFLVNHAVEIPIFQDLTERHLERMALDVIRLCRVKDARLLERASECSADRQLVAC